MAARLVERDPALRLSRSWTTRPPRPGERPDAYVFVTREDFESRIAAGGFLEWAEFLGELYGTPWSQGGAGTADPDDPAGQGEADDDGEGHDLLLEIDVQGAAQVKALRPDAVVVLLIPPSDEELVARLESRGDPPERVAVRVAKGREEVEEARRLADHVVVNDDLATAVDQVAAIIGASRTAESTGDPWPRPAPP